MFAFPINRLWLPSLAVLLLMRPGIAQDCPVQRALVNQTRWCWAAVDEMMFEYIRGVGTFDQCQSAEQAASAGLCGLPGNCCGDPASCNAGCTTQISSFLSATPSG